MTDHEIWTEVKLLHAAGKRQEVIDLLRTYGLFTDESVVQDYLEKGCEL